MKRGIEMSNTVKIIDNEKEYYLEIDVKSGNVIYSSSYATQDVHKDSYIQIEGVLYNTNKEINEHLMLDPEKMVGKLEGLFSMVVVKNEKAYIITDRTNSHKAYYIIDGNLVKISSNIERLIPTNYKLDVGAVMNFIINNCLINEKTIFEGIKFVPGGSVLKVSDGHVNCQQYYSFDFTDYYSDELAISEIRKALKRGTDNLLNSSDKPLLAMSGGWDARGIMFYMCKDNNIPFSSFSYKDTRYDNHCDTDADISKKIAEKKHVNHSILELYHGDFIHLLEENAKVGKCISAFCYELDSFEYLKSKGYTDIIFGDHIFGYGKKDIAIRSKESVLQQIAVYKSQSTKTLRKYFIDKNTYDYIMKCLDDEVDKMYNTSSKITNYTDKKDFLYYQQRLMNMLMPLRQMIGGLVGRIHMPFLNNDAINVCQHLSTGGRVDKKLYKKALLEEFPDLFEIPYAKYTGRDVDWSQEIKNSSNALKKKLDFYPPELELVFPKEVVLKLIEYNDANSFIKKIRYYKSLFIASVGYLRRRFSFFDKLANKLYGPHCGVVDKTSILINVLYVMEYLESLERK